MSSLILRDFAEVRRALKVRFNVGIKGFLADVFYFVIALVVYPFVLVVEFGVSLVRLFVRIKDWLVFVLWRKNRLGKIAVAGLAVFFVAILAVFYDFVGLLLTDTQLAEQLSKSRYVKADYEGNILLSEYGNVILDFDIQDAFSFYTFYTVQKGDTLEKIAKAHGVKVETVMWANNLSKYSILKVGQKLKIPLEDGVIHVVKKGDTIEKIAKKYKSTVQDILEANWLDSPDQISVGMELFVPQGTMPTQEVQRVVKRITSGTGGNYKTPPVYKTSCANFPKFLTSWPVAGGGRVSRGSSTYHKALDITYRTADNKHPYILAAADGRVAFAGIKGCGYRSRRCGYAWTVVIDHGNGFSTLYAHLQANSLLVKPGQYVKAGQAIARMGNTGYTVGGSGIHLHFEVRTTGTWDRAHRYNPLCFFK